MAYPDRGACSDPKLFSFLCGGGSGGGGGGGGLSFTTKAQHFYSGQYGSNDLPRPRRSPLLYVSYAATLKESQHV